MEFEEKYTKEELNEEKRMRRKARKELIPKLLHKYQPDVNIIFLDPESDKPERMIFEIKSDYLEHEEESLKELDKMIEKHEKCSEINESFDRANKLRFLQGNHFKIKKTIDNMIDHIKFTEHRIPKILYKEALELLEKGLQYSHGRDRHFRPVVICRFALLNQPKLNFDDAINAAFYSTFYMMDTLLVPGKCENWQVILDLESLAVFKLPIKFSIKFLELSQEHEKCRTCCFFLVNVTFAIRAFYRIVSPFLDNKIKEKLIMSKDNTHPKILELIHPSQVEKKYGGEAENLECYWPPKYISDEYGHDPNYVKDSIQEDISDLSDSEINEAGNISRSINVKDSPFKSSSSSHNRNNSISNRSARHSKRNDEDECIKVEDVVIDSSSLPKRKSSMSQNVSKPVKSAGKEGHCKCVIF